MNNEERILSMLEQLTSDVAGLKAGQAKLESGQSKLESGQSKLEDGQAKLESGQAKLESGQSNLATEIADVKAIAMHIENDHGRQLGLLVDGHMQNADKLSRIEAEITRHEEVILRRVR